MKNVAVKNLAMVQIKHNWHFYDKIMRINVKNSAASPHTH